MRRNFAGNHAGSGFTVPDHPDVLISMDNLAAYLGTSRRTIDRFAITGSGPKRCVLGHKLVRFRWGDVLAWIEHNGRNSTSDPGNR